MPANKKLLWTGWILTILPALGLIFSAAMKFMKPPEVLQEFNRLGLPENLALTIGIIEITCTIIYLVPRTAILGAVLLTGYLGGAILTHLRIADPFISPIIVALLLWAGIYLREPRLRQLLPIRLCGSCTPVHTPEPQEETPLAK